jgi:hypothetical protein
MVTRTGMWPFKEQNNSVLFPDVMVFNIHAFIMEAFFFLTGFLAVKQYLKYGPRYFVIERLMRVGIPFAIGLAVLVPFIIFLFPWGAAWELGNVSWNGQIWMHDAAGLIADNFYPLAHLWFLFYLSFYLSLFWFVAKWLLPGLHKQIRGKAAGLLLLAMWLAVVLCYQWHADWTIKNPLTTTLEWASWWYYLLFFALGAFCSLKANDFFFLLARQYRWWLLAGWVVLGLVAPWLQTMKVTVSPWQWQATHLLATSAEALLTLFALAAVTGFVHKPSAPGKTERWLVSSSYWVYLTHMPLVMLFQILLLPMSIPLFVKFMLALALSLGVCFATYSIFGNRLLSTLKPGKPHVTLS